MYSFLLSAYKTINYTVERRTVGDIDYRRDKREKEEREKEKRRREREKKREKEDIYINECQKGEN